MYDCKLDFSSTVPMVHGMGKEMFIEKISLLVYAMELLTVVLGVKQSF